jgi:hypothetical protein
VGLLGKKNKEAKHGCVKHVVPTTDTEWTHTDAGQNEWEETQNVLDRQVRLRAPLLQPQLLKLPPARSLLGPVSCRASSIGSLPWIFKQQRARRSSASTDKTREARLLAVVCVKVAV